MFSKIAVMKFALIKFVSGPWLMRFFRSDLIRMNQILST